jgi:hypothetical protein
MTAAETQAMPSDPEPLKITCEHGVWVLRVERAGGKLQEYHCATEAQARQLQQALQPRPP